MSKSNAAENAFLLLLFNATTWNLIAENDSTSSVANLYVSLHTGDPGEAGDQTTNEAAYTSYARVAVARTAGGWTVSSNTSSNTALFQFPECTGGSETETYVGIGTDASGAGQLLYSGALTSSRAISNGITPQFAALALVATED